MPTSEARIKANQQNAAQSTGPKTDEGKEKSRANALKHGLTGAGVVMVAGDAGEVKRRGNAFAAELNATGEVGMALCRIMAMSSVRVERSADQQALTLALHVNRAVADFVEPEGLDEAQVARLRDETARRAMFDPSKEAELARKYHASAERSFYRALKELRAMQRSAKAEARAMMGSFSPEPGEDMMTDEEFDALYAELKIPLPRRPVNSPQTASLDGRADLPIAPKRPG